jgi:hypothetical protein
MGWGEAISARRTTVRGGRSETNLGELERRRGNLVPDVFAHVLALAELAQELAVAGEGPKQPATLAYRT